MKRSLAIIAIAGVLLIVALVISLILIASLNNKLRKDSICFTPGCVHTASKILENMDPGINPCDDFFKFACGGFTNSTTIPDDKTRIDTFTVVEDKLNEQIRRSLEEPIDPNELKAFKLAKNFYNTCMNTSAIEKAGLEPLRKILRDLGKWPVLEGDNWKGDDFNWIKTTHECQKMGCGSDNFIAFGIGIDWQHGTKYNLVLDQPSFDLAREYLVLGMEEKVVKAHLKYMVDVAVLLGADEKRATEELREALEFEIALANISLPDEKRRNFTLLHNPMTITELTEKYPSINWEEYINLLLPPTMSVTADEVILVLEPSYLSAFEEVIKNTSKRVQANYAMWRVAESAIATLNEDMRQIQLDYSSVLNGKRERRTRWKDCVSMTLEAFSISTSTLYIRKYFQEAAKQNANEMVGDIMEQLTKLLQEAEWMDKETKAKALEKAAAMTSHIAYPDELLDDKKVEEFHSGLDLEPNDLFGNVLNLSLFATNYSFEKLRKPVNKSEWITHGRPAVVNAFYMPTENSIQIPAGILQGTFFNIDRPRYMNYGAIGFVIGHEITHGFDDKGKQFDKLGNLVDWWAPETREKYMEKAACIVNQYGNYTDESVGLKLNGITTQGENIADNGGIKEAYLAYKEWVRRNGPELKLPGLDYTPEQMFWIGAANTWCMKYRPEALKHYITTEVHSPGRFRVLGPFSNRPEFAEDFNCPVGSAMNPERKCTIW